MRKLLALGLVLGLLGCDTDKSETKTYVSSEGRRLKLLSREDISVPGQSVYELGYVWVDKITHKEFICLYQSGCVYTGRLVDNDGNELK